MYIKFKIESTLEALERFVIFQFHLKMMITVLGIVICTFKNICHTRDSKNLMHHTLCPRDYVVKVNFELISFKCPNQSAQTCTIIELATFKKNWAHLEMLFCWYVSHEKFKDLKNGCLGAGNCIFSLYFRFFQTTNAHVLH